MKELSKFKILNYPNHLKELVDRKDTLPITIEMDPINRCNHNCIWCADNKIRRSRDMLDLEFLQRILGELYNIGAKSIIFKGGGEPTLHPDISKFIQLSTINFKTALLTNGANLSDDLIQTIVDNCEYIRISLDAVDKKSHDRWHRPDMHCGWDKIISNIKKLVEIKKKNKSGIKIGINILYDNISFYQMPKAIDVAKSLDIDILSFRRAYTTEYGFKHDPWEQYELSHCKYLIDSLKVINHGIYIIFDASRGEEIYRDTAERNLPECLATPLISIICADKKVYPCCDLRLMKDYCYGDLTKNTFEEIWHSEQRKMILEEKIIPKQCFKYCTHRFTYFNEMLNYLVSPDKPHKELL